MKRTGSECLKKSFHFRPGCEIIGKSACASGGKTHSKSLAEIACLEISADKSGHHGVAGAYGIDKCALGSRSHVRSVLREKDSSFAGHRDQDIPRAFLLELLRIRDHFVLCAESDAIDLAELVVVGFDQPGAKAQYLGEKALLGVYDYADIPALKSLHDPLIYILGERTGNASGDDQDIAGNKVVQLLIEQADIFLSDERP